MFYYFDIAIFVFTWCWRWYGIQTTNEFSMPTLNRMTPTPRRIPFVKDKWHNMCWVTWLKRKNWAIDGGGEKKEREKGSERAKREKKKMEFAHDRRIPDEYQWSRTTCQSQRIVIRHAYEQRRASHVSGSIAFNWTSRIELARSNYLPVLRALHALILDGSSLRWYISYIPPKLTKKYLSFASKTRLEFSSLFLDGVFHF